MNCLAVGLGGFAGAVLRYLIGLIPTGETMIFPVKTFCINVIGCIVIGAITVLAAKLSVPPRMILFLKVGVCGGFTTFSTFALESSDLIRDGHMGIALCYVLLSVLVGVLIAIPYGIAISKSPAEVAKSNKLSGWEEYSPALEEFINETNIAGWSSSYQTESWLSGTV